MLMKFVRVGQGQIAAFTAATGGRDKELRHTNMIATSRSLEIHYHR